MRILIYGAYGYTGKLVVNEAMRKGLKPTVSGRDFKQLEQLAEETGLEFLTLPLDKEEVLCSALEHFDVVIHCAGPFSETAEPMVQACIASKCHYLDITGEYEVFEMILKHDKGAKEAGVMLLPGAGFDVVPSDCLAAYLKSQLPSATQLTLAFAGLGAGISRGTMKTMVQNAHAGQKFRDGGLLKERKAGSSVRTIDYGEFQQLSVGISWGDISTAYFSTGIPNIEVLTGTTPKQIKQMKRMYKFGWLVKTGIAQSYLQGKIDKNVSGPGYEKRAESPMFLWGQVQDGQQTVEARLTTPNGYTLTALTSIHIAHKIMDGDFKTGYQTPSTAYGEDLILEIEGCSRY